MNFDNPDSGVSCWYALEKGRFLMADTPAKPRLEDPLHEKEIFASEVVGIAMVQGTFVVTLAAVRFDEPAGSQTAKVRRIVTGRVVLTNVAANQLLTHLQNIAAQIEAAAAAAAGHKPN
jgi:hypothetical protein